MQKSNPDPELEEKRKAWMIWLRDIDKELTEDTSVWLSIYSPRIYEDEPKLVANKGRGQGLSGNV